MSAPPGSSTSWGADRLKKQKNLPRVVLRRIAARHYDHVGLARRHEFLRLRDWARMPTVPPYVAPSFRRDLLGNLCLS